MHNTVKVHKLLGITGNEDAEMLLLVLLGSIKRKQKITVSFEKINCITSRFVNTGFIPLLKHVEFEDIKKYVFIVDSNKQINSIINKRFKFEVDGVSS